MLRTSQTYPSLPDPILLLLREPSVLKELNLKSEQRRKITQLNHSQDGMLLTIRNKPLEQQSEQYARQISQTRQLINETLSADQRYRIQQIQIRIRGYRSLLEPSIAERLTLTDDQQHSLQGLFTTLDDEFEQLRQNASDPKNAPRDSNECRHCSRTHSARRRDSLPNTTAAIRGLGRKTL